MSDPVTDILRREGGFVDRTDDAGGPTKFGITIPTLAAWRGHPCERADIVALTEDEARSIYGELFIRRPGFDAIADSRLQGLVIDCAVLHGTGTVVRWLQAALGQRTDGVFGPFTRSALAVAPPGTVFQRLLSIRLRFIGNLITRTPSQAVFAAGWCDRLAEFITG